MNILTWLLYIKALVYLIQPVGSMGLWGRLCGTQLANMVAFVCEGRGYYTGETDSPFLSERQAKTFTNGGRRRTGKIVTECCDNYCNLQIIESYCAPLQEGPTKPIRHGFLHERERLNEQHNRVEDLPPANVLPPEQEEDQTIPDVSQELVFSDHEYDSMLDSDLINIPQIMVADQAPDTTEENTEELLHKDKVVKSGTNATTRVESRAEVDEEMVSETSNKNSGRTKGNPRTHRPSSRERKGKRRNSKEKKRGKSKSGSKERRERRKKNKSKNKKNRRKKNRQGQEEFTQPSSLITDIEVLHPQARIVAESRSEPVHTFDDPTDPGSRSERSFLTTITAKLLDVIGLQQQNNNQNRRRR